MGKQYQMTDIEYRVIKSHNDRMIDAAKEGAAQCRMIRKMQRTPYILNQIAYYTNAISGYRWSTAIARQAAGVPVDAQ